MFLHLSLVCESLFFTFHLCYLSFNINSVRMICLCYISVFVIYHTISISTLFTWSIFALYHSILFQLCRYIWSIFVISLSVNLVQLYLWVYCLFFHCLFLDRLIFFLSSIFMLLYGYFFSKGPSLSKSFSLSFSMCLFPHIRPFFGVFFEISIFRRPAICSSLFSLSHQIRYFHSQ